MASTSRNSGLSKLYFITMDDGPVDHLRQVESACEAGIRLIQLRMKRAGPDMYRVTALAAKAICDRWSCTLVINDRVDIASELGLSCVHLGLQDMAVQEARRLLGPGAVIGGTANTIGDIRDRVRQGVNYIGLGPYRYTNTKERLSPLLGLNGYQRIMDELRRDGTDIPVMAIGGIRKEDIGGLLEAGVYGVAFSGMLVHAEDRVAMVQELEEEIRKVKVPIVRS